MDATNTTHTAAKALFEVVKNTFSAFVTGLKDLKWEDIPAGAQQYIQDNPGLTTVQVLAILLVVCSGLVMGPVLAALGFGSLGPIAGSAASAYQAAHGAAVAESAFSFLQSAAMGGATASGYLVGGVKAVGLAAVGVAEAVKRWG